MKAKVILWSIVSLVIIGIAVNAFLWLRKPQVITLPGGTKLTLLGVTYGKHHAPPKTKPAGRNVRGGARLDSTNNTLMVWILAEHKPNDYQWQNNQLLVYDRANTACVSTWPRTQSQVRNGADIEGFLLDAYPRWDQKIVLRVLANMNGNERLAKEQFVVSNPARNSGATWTAEPVPDTQSAGDLNVTLAKFVYGVRGFRGGSGNSSKDPMSKAVLTAFHSEQNGVVTTNWQPIRIETSDATGNQAENNSWSNGRDENGDATLTYQWGLWPGQAPWRLRVEMSQTAGFSPDELWSVTNVPVRPGSQSEMWNFNATGRRTPAAFAETTLNGIHLKLFPAIQITNQMSGNGEKPGGFRVQADKPLDGMQLTLVSATDENGRIVSSWGGNSMGGDSRQIQLRNLRNAKSLNLTVALHKSRFVEFTAKPEKAPAASPE